MQAELQDRIIPSEFDLSVKLPVFEGPLDLLLFLLRKNEIDIYDIPIEQITRQYLGVLRAMEHLSLDIAGEFFVMAATLMYIKSRMLLPTDERANQAQEEEDSDLDPRWQLVEQLLEYKKVKQRAALIEDLALERQNCLPRICKEKDLADTKRPLKNSDRIEIWNTFNNVLRRLAEKLVEGEIVGEHVSVADRMEFILNLKSDEVKFSELFEKGKTTISLLVATFLAVLELTRLRRLDIAQNESFGEIYIKKLPERAAAEAQKVSENSPETDLSDWQGDEGKDSSGEVDFDGPWAFESGFDSVESGGDDGEGGDMKGFSGGGLSGGKGKSGGSDFSDSEIGKRGNSGGESASGCEGVRAETDGGESVGENKGEDFR